MLTANYLFVMFWSTKLIILLPHNSIHSRSSINEFETKYFVPREYNNNIVIFAMCVFTSLSMQSQYLAIPIGSSEFWTHVRYDKHESGRYLARRYRVYQWYKSSIENKISSFSTKTQKNSRRKTDERKFVLFSIPSNNHACDTKVHPTRRSLHIKSVWAMLTQEDRKLDEKHFRFH